MSAATVRAVDRAQQFAQARRATQVEPIDLLAAILSDEDAQATALLRRLNIDPSSFLAGLRSPADTTAAYDKSRPLSASASAIVRRAQHLARRYSRQEVTQTEDLLAAILESDPELATRWEHHGIQSQSFLDEYHRDREPATIPVDDELLVQTPSGRSTELDVARIIDANANRARESLRLLEDVARFVNNDKELCATIKEQRHRLRQILGMIPDRWLVISRDVEHDVGTSVATPDEYAREGAPAIVAANSKRAQEAIRSLEECTKIEFPSAAREFEQLRYSLYDVERRLVVIGHAQNRLKNVALYWLVDPAACPRSLDWMIKRAVAGGVQMIQLRDKSSGDLERIERARAVRRWTRDLVVLLIINDRPDIARLSDADGVHLGQADLPVRDARRIVGPDMLIGVSTHNIDQARKAVADGADYLGLGPVFPSHTKSFDQYIGLDGVRQIAERIGLPVFCIGGITPSNIRQVVDSGGSRVAVSHCLCAVDDPFPIARELASLLERRAS